jgi:hypothetical protein
MVFMYPGYDVNVPLNTMSTECTADAVFTASSVRFTYERTFHVRLFCK